MPEETENEDGTTTPEWSATAAPLAPVRVPGDERERVVLLEARVRGNRVLLDGLLALALVTALFGNWLVPAALLALVSLSGWLTEDYAHERQVDAAGLSEQSRASLLRLRPAGTLIATLLILGAMSYTGFTGEGLIPSLGAVTTGPEADPIVRSGAGSLPVVAAVGLVVLVIREALRRRRPRPDAGRAAR